MLLWVVLGFWASWPNHKLVGGNVLLFILLVLIGWQLFGPPVQTP